VILFSIHSDEWKSFHSQHQTALRIRQWHYNLTSAESKFKTPMLDHQDKHMMKAQHMLRGRLLASFQDREHKGGDTRSQGGIKDNKIKIKIQDHNMQMISQRNSQEQGPKIQESVKIQEANEESIMLYCCGGGGSGRVVVVVAVVAVKTCSSMVNGKRYWFRRHAPPLLTSSSHELLAWSSSMRSCSGGGRDSGVLPGSNPAWLLASTGDGNSRIIFVDVSSCSCVEGPIDSSRVTGVYP
nr:hypothetical protein [Tanacetum cinerariifolium]